MPGSCDSGDPPNEPGGVRRKLESSSVSSLWSEPYGGDGASSADAFPPPVPGSNRVAPAEPTSSGGFDSPSAHVRDPPRSPGGPPASSSVDTVGSVFACVSAESLAEGSSAEVRGTPGCGSVAGRSAPQCVHVGRPSGVLLSHEGHLTISTPVRVRPLRTLSPKLPPYAPSKDTLRSHDNPQPARSEKSEAPLAARRNCQCLPAHCPHAPRQAAHLDSTHPAVRRHPRPRPRTPPRRTPDLPHLSPVRLRHRPTPLPRRPPAEMPHAPRLRNTPPILSPTTSHGPRRPHRRRRHPPPRRRPPPGAQSCGRASPADRSGRPGDVGTPRLLRRGGNADPAPTSTARHGRTTRRRPRNPRSLRTPSPLPLENRRPVHQRRTDPTRSSPNHGNRTQHPPPPIPPRRRSPSPPRPPRHLDSLPPTHGPQPITSPSRPDHPRPGQYAHSRPLAGTRTASSRLVGVRPPPG